MFSKVLIANRGVAAVRIARTLQRLGIISVALRSKAERGNGYFEAFDEVYDLTGDSVAETYLDVAQILDVARRADVQAIHPGYGFLSENAAFATRVASRSFAFRSRTAAFRTAFSSVAIAFRSCACHLVVALPLASPPPASPRSLPFGIR